MKNCAHFKPVSLLVGLIISAGWAKVAWGGSDEDALNLADTAPVVVHSAGPWKVSTEVSTGRIDQRYGLGDYNQTRLSLDAYYDAMVSPNWRLIFADRIDHTHHLGGGESDTLNTLKEVYTSWHPEGNAILDIGRINARYGVAYGYNPTDFFRSGAIRSITSIDPNSLRENRLGTAMLRGQVLFPQGSISAMYAPKLARAPSDGAWNADFGATNNRERWLLSGSHQFSESISSQLLLFGGKGQSVQAGANFSALISPTTVGYVEWSGGSNRLLYDEAIGASGPKSFRQRVATGLTYTNTRKVSLTTEIEYNGTGLGKNEWLALGGAVGPNYMRYRIKAQDLLELPTKTALFFYGTWQDALVSRLDLKAMVRLNMADYSRLNWIEARYHLTKIDVALQVQSNSGNAFTEWGALPQRRVIQTLLTYFF